MSVVAGVPVSRAVQREAAGRFKTDRRTPQEKAFDTEYILREAWKIREREMDEIQRFGHIIYAAGAGRPFKPRGPEDD